MDDPWKLVALLIAALGCSFGAGSYAHNRQRYLAERLKNAEFRRRIAHQLEHPRLWRLYLDGLDKSLRFLGRHMGRPLGWRAFGVCLTFGLVYGFAFLLTAWGLGAPATLGPTVLLPDLAQPWRAMWAALGLGWLAAIVALLWWRERVDAAVLGWLGRRLGAAPTARRTRLVLGVLVGIFVVAVIFGTKLARGDPFGRADIRFAISLGAGAFALAGAFAVAGALAGAGAGAFAVAVAGALLWLLTGQAALSDPAVLGIVLFYVILPLLNALWDWLSWWASRALGESLLGLWRGEALLPGKVALAALHILLDLALALVFLAALAWSLPAVIDGWNALALRLGSAAEPLPLREFLCAAARQPLSTGLWATLMLFSTLFPTALHAAAVIASPVGALVAHLPRVRRLAPALLAEKPDDNVIHDAAWVLTLWRVPAYLAGLVLTVAAGWAVFHLLALLLGGPVPEWLLMVALRDPAAAAACLGAVELPLPP